MVIILVALCIFAVFFLIRRRRMATYGNNQVPCALNPKS